MDNRPSRTAMGSAVLRTSHLRDDAPPWILEDELSEQLVDDGSLELIRAEIGRWSPEVRAGFRLAHAVRSRVAEDAALEGLAAQRRDYVILGAGLDTFAWRHPAAAQFRIWEIDHPATQGWKREALGARALGEPPNVHFVPVDLAATPLAEVDTPALATWNWLGVTMYVDPSVTAQVLDHIGHKDAGTTLVVNFVLAGDEVDDLGQAVQATAARVVSAAGEPVVATYRREQCVELLESGGFSSVSVLDADALKERYFPDRADLRLPGSTLIAVARV